MTCLLVPVLLLSSSLLASSLAPESNVPTFELNDLLTGHRSDELATILSTTGLLAVNSLLPSSSRVQALDGLCHCAPQLTSPTAERTSLQDDTTTQRTTVATATAGATPLPLPHDLPAVCGRDTVQAMEQLRDHVSTVTDAFVVALDRLLMGTTLGLSSENGTTNSQYLLKNKYGGTYPTISSLQTAANHLEHFHIYSKETEDDIENNKNTLKWHTDAGLFLSFVPARDCQESNTVDKSFLLPSGDAAVFDPSSIVIMLGAGAQHWLRTKFPLKATKHAVNMQPGQVRAWYGMMTLIPEIALVQEEPEPQTFGDMKRHMSLSARQRRLSVSQDDAVVSIGCGVHEPDDEVSSLQLSSSASPPQRRRLQHVQSPDACNNETNFFCWMSCLDIPDAGKIDGYLSEGYSLYCMDPAIYASSQGNVADAVEPCPYGVHNSNCQGKWAPTSPTVPGYDLGRNTSNLWDSGRFCYGGTSMYMDGFHWTDTTCVIYLFPEWVLSSEGKLVAASLGTLLFGAVLEYVIYQRRKTVGAMAPGHVRLGASALFYGLQLTMGYMLMLVVMTYSGPLFLCVVLGLVFGHVLFNSKDAFWGKKLHNKVKTDRDDNLGHTTSASEHGVPSDETRYFQNEDGSSHRRVVAYGGAVDAEHGGTSCCNDNNDGTGSPTGSSAPDNDKEDDNDVPEGITPCCQNEL